MTNEPGQPSLADALRASLMKDKLVAVSCLNGEIQVGDRVAFATLSHKSAHLRVGEVAELHESSVKIKYQIETWNRKTLNRSITLPLGHVVKVAG